MKITTSEEFCKKGCEDGIKNPDCYKDPCPFIEDTAEELIYSYNTGVSNALKAVLPVIKNFTEQEFVNERYRMEAVEALKEIEKILEEK